MPEKLQDFLTAHEIDVRELARIKHRLFVVGRFNRAPVDAQDNPPQTFLFTNRPKGELSPEYLGLFDKKFDLGFENFVQALQPSIAEQVVQQRPNGIPAVIQHMPSQEKDSDEGSVVIDTWNYFFWRAAARSKQEAFKSGASGLDGDLLADDSDHGKSIYKQIRRNLNLLSRFQPRTTELVDAFSDLLESTAMFNGLPPYASGAALPGGFLEKLIDFLYWPDLNTDFSLDGVDLTDPVWEKLYKNENSRESLTKVVNTFRNVLVGAADQHSELTISGGVRIYQKAKDLLGRRSGLVEKFGQARDAYNSLNQIVRSKVLLSMVLEWVFKAHYDLEEVKAQENDAQKDQKVADLILGKEEHDGVAEPIKRATTEERDRFRTGLTDNFAKVILAVLAEDDRADALIKALPAEVRPVATSLRADADSRMMLQRMAGTGDPMPFIDSQKSVIVDVLMPVLYQTPIFSKGDLKRLFRHEVQAAYLTAITLDDKYQDVIREVAEDFLPTFLGNIDGRSRQIRDAEKMQGDLLRLYIERIANPQMAARVIEAQEMISRAMTVIENLSLKPGEVRGASYVTPFLDAKGGAAEETPLSVRNAEAMGNLGVEIVKEVVEAAAVEKIVDKVSVDAGGKKPAAANLAAGNTTTAAKVASAASGATAAPSSSETTSGTPPAATAAPRSESEAPEPNGLDETVRARVLAAFLPGKKVTPADIDDFRKSVIKDKEIEDQASDAMRIFHQILSTIYERYGENDGMEAFVGRVDRMTMANLLLNNKETLGLGKASSNLYAMLLDVVQNMNAENPDPKDFIKKYSLTRYFDNDVLDRDERRRSGVTELRQVLRSQTEHSLANTVSFISELRGIKYLMDLVKNDSNAEIVVVNATAEEFLDWLDRDNLERGPHAKQRLQSAFIHGGGAQGTASPGLVYLTDSAFAKPSMSGKLAWLESLKTKRLQNGNLRLIMPPLCLSTGVQDEQWDTEGESFAKVASPTGIGEEVVPAPVVIVGPSPYLNVEGDAFRTYLPAGYLFAAHFLCKPDQRIENRAVITADKGRFRVIGAGIGQMRNTLERILWSGDADDTYSFAADFYLYMLLTVLATAKNNIRPQAQAPTAESFFRFFTGRGPAGVAANEFRTSEVLTPALFGNALSFCLKRNEEGAFTSVEFIPPKADGIVPPTGGETNIQDIQWFNQALQKADLPK